MVRRVWRRRGGRRSSSGPFDRLGGPVDGLSGLINGLFLFLFSFWGYCVLVPIFNPNYDFIPTFFHFAFLPLLF